MAAAPGKRTLPAYNANCFCSQHLPPVLHPIYQDEHLLVLNKPAGLLCVPGRGPDKQDCLSLRAQQQWPDALIVHRLDQATSGLVVMARNPQVQRQLGDAFAARQVDKRYMAVVWGTPQASAVPADNAHLASMPTDGETWHLIDQAIAADWERRPLRVVDAATGKPSQTWWRAVTAAEASALPTPPPCSTRVWLAPVTGRTHQLRVHMQAVGCPILGDGLYATEDVRALSPRLLLQAQQLGFAHPVTGGRVEWALAAEF